jgi:membrane protease YdiL (CAAX protease family)
VTPSSKPGASKPAASAKSPSKPSSKSGSSSKSSKADPPSTSDSSGSSKPAAAEPVEGRPKGRVPQAAPRARKTRRSTATDAAPSTSSAGKSSATKSTAKSSATKSTATKTSGKSTATSKRVTPPKGQEPDEPPVKGWRALLGPTDPDYVKPRDRERPWWGMGDMAVWFLVSQVAGGIAYYLAAVLGGYSLYWPVGPGTRVGEVVGRVGSGQAPYVTPTVIDMPLWLTQLIQIPLWIGFLGGPLYVSWRKGSNLKDDFGATMEWKDIPLGLAIGAVCQIVVLWVIYKLLFLIIGTQDVSADARALTSKATSPVLTVVLLVGVTVLSPVFEELFFRGLSMRAIAKRFGPRWGIVLSALFFAFAHFQTLQFPGLFMFGLVLGWLANRYGRLGPSIWAHIGFNVVAAVSLLLGT